jgi:hypothetical protein
MVTSVLRAVAAALVVLSTIERATSLGEESAGKGCDNYSFNE